MILLLFFCLLDTFSCKFVIFFLCDENLLNIHLIPNLILLIINYFKYGLFLIHDISHNILFQSFYNSLFNEGQSKMCPEIKPEKLNC